jgi:hypothetical protein
VSFAHRYGPTALVAGASEGIGAAIAASLARRGIDLVLAARRLEPLEALAEKLRREHGVAARPVAVDLGEEAGLDALTEAVAGQEIGLLVCSAAVAPIGEYLDRDEAEHARLLAVNCRAPALLAHRFGRLMAARGRGGILLLTSLAAHQGSALVAHYAASKAYQRVLAEGLWAELSPRGVDVLACLAGPTETPTYRAGKPRDGAWIEWPPVMPAEDVADAALDALGRGPVLTPGIVNRVAGTLMRRLLPTRLAVRAVSASTRAMYRKPR